MLILLDVPMDGCKYKFFVQLNKEIDLRSFANVQRKNTKIGPQAIKKNRICYKLTILPDMIVFI